MDVEGPHGDSHASGNPSRAPIPDVLQLRPVERKLLRVAGVLFLAFLPLPATLTTSHPSVALAIGGTLLASAALLALIVGLRVLWRMCPHWISLLPTVGAICSVLAIGAFFASPYLPPTIADFMRQSLGLLVLVGTSLMFGGIFFVLATAEDRRLPRS